MGRKRKAKRRVKQQGDIFCNPDICDECVYIGEGDSVCLFTQNIVLADWIPTNYVKDCPKEKLELQKK